MCSSDLVRILAFGFADVLQRQPAEFVEAAAEAAQGLVFVAVELQVGRGVALVDSMSEVRSASLSSCVVAIQVVMMFLGIVVDNSDMR